MKFVQTIKEKVAALALKMLGEDWVKLDPNQGVGFQSVQPSCGELGLELDVEGVKGTVYISKEMWMSLGHSMGWCEEPEW